MDDFAINLANEEVLELATAFVEKYASYVEDLPFDLQRKVTRLREIDCSCREILTEIETLHGNFIKEKDINVARKSTQSLLKIQCLFGRCQELGDEKISIVQQVSEIIENKKKAVEHSGYRFQALYRPDQKSEYNSKRELGRMDYSKGPKRPRRQRNNYSDKHDKEKASPMDTVDDEAYFEFAVASSSTNPYSEKPNVDGSNAAGNLNKSSESSQLKHEHFSARKSEKLEKKEPSPASSTSSGNAISSIPSQKSTSSKPLSIKSTMPSSKAIVSSTVSNGSNKSSTKRKKKNKKSFKSVEKPVRSPSPGPDIPIDPDEPTYCLCDQVSYGQMIGCDNKKCTIEWFHFSCVGLSHKPKGKWYCPDCTKDMKDRRRDNKKDHR